MKKSWNAYIPAIFFSFLGVFVYFFFYCPIETEDVWFHLATGRWILEHKTVPWEDPFAFSSPAPVWIFTEWLGSVIYYLIYLLGHWEGLKVFRALIFLGTLLFFWKAHRRHMPWPLLFLLIFVAVYGLNGRVLLRPLIFNFFFVELYLWVLFRHHQGRKDVVWVLPLLSAVWFNLHLGAFVYGLSLIGIFFLNAVVKFLNSKAPAERSANLAKAKSLLFVGLGCLLACAIGPYGWPGFMYPFETFLIPANIRLLFLNTVTEQLAPGYLLGLRGTWFYILTLWAVFMILRNKKDQFLYTLLFSFPFFLFLHGSRGRDLFVLVAIWIIAECARDLRLNEKWATWVNPRRAAVINIFLLGVLLTTGIHVFQQKVILTDGVQRYKSLAFEPLNVVSVVDFLKKNNIQGNVFNTEVAGGYLTWAGYPALRPFVDGRKLNNDQFQEYIMLHISPEHYWPYLQKKYDFQIVILDGNSPQQDNLLNYFNAREDWKLVFVDGANVIFVKRGYYVLSPEATNLVDRLGEERFQEKTLSVAARLPSAYCILYEYFVPPPVYVKANEEAAALFALRYYSAALNCAGQGLSRDWSTRTRDLYSAMLEEARKRVQAQKGMDK